MRPRMLWRIIRTASLFVAACILPVAAAQQTTIDDYDSARDGYFWPKLYDIGGESLYCDLSLDPEERETTSGARLTVEHAYPADWIAEARGCQNRDNCEDDIYQFASADLHNLWPALGRVNSSRQDLPFGEIPGEEHRRFTEDCPDYERTSGADAIVEPRDAVKGDIARSMLYMILTYDLPTYGLGPLLLEWHAADLKWTRKSAQPYE